jgi:hypothetical protein
MLDGVLLLWFILTGLSVIFVIWDSISNTPVSWVQKLAWILVTAYTGPIGLFLFLMACRNPGPGLHDAFTRPHWKQAVNSEMHCLAGDATGIILAAFVVSYFGLPNGIDLIFEYLSAFVVGLLIFQALMMKGMYGDYATAVRKTFFAETVSMNMVMVGMIPTMVILMHHLPYGDDPLHPLFWFIMGLASIAGGITAYPINSRRPTSGTSRLRWQGRGRAWRCRAAARWKAWRWAAARATPCRWARCRCRRCSPSSP